MYKYAKFGGNMVHTYKLYINQKEWRVGSRSGNNYVAPSPILCYTQGSLEDVRVFTKNNEYKYSWIGRPIRAHKNQFANESEGLR